MAINTGSILVKPRKCLLNKCYGCSVPAKWPCKNVIEKIIVKHQSGGEETERKKITKKLVYEALK